MGSALGVALFGAIANATLGYGQQTHSAAELARASHHVFVGVAVVAALMGLAVVAMPVVRPTPSTPPAADDAADASDTSDVATPRTSRPSRPRSRSLSPPTTCDQARRH